MKPQHPHSLRWPRGSAAALTRACPYIQRPTEQSPRREDITVNITAFTRAIRTPERCLGMAQIARGIVTLQDRLRLPPPPMPDPQDLVPNSQLHDQLSITSHSLMESNESADSLIYSSASRTELLDGALSFHSFLGFPISASDVAGRSSWNTHRELHRHCRIDCPSSLSILTLRSHRSEPARSPRGYPDGLLRMYLTTRAPATAAGLFTRGSVPGRRILAIGSSGGAFGMLRRLNTEWEDPPMIGYMHTRKRPGPL